MIKNRKLLWLGFISSLILGAALFTACGADIPADVAPTDPPAAEAGSAVDGDSDDTEVVNDITEIFSDASESTESSSESNSEALPADGDFDGNVPIGFTENGNPYRGDPNAPVVIEEFSDFQ